MPEQRHQQHLQRLVARHRDAAALWRRSMLDGARRDTVSERTFQARKRHITIMAEVKGELVRIGLRQLADALHDAHRAMYAIACLRRDTDNRTYEELADWLQVRRQSLRIIHDAITGE